MKTAQLLFVFGLLFSLSFAGNDLEDIRNQFYSAATDKKETKQFHDDMKKLSRTGSPEIKGYTAMSWMLKARDSYSPYHKISHFNKGRKMLESAIKSDFQSAELRFLRFSVQTNAPFFLGYNGKIENDKAFLMDHILDNKNYESDPDLYDRIKDFLLNCEKVTVVEKTYIKNYT